MSRQASPSGGQRKDNRRVPNLIRANRDTLFLVAGLVWAGVGLMLGYLAVRWLLQAHVSSSVRDWLLAILAAAGLVAGTFIERGFSGIVRRNLQRIRGLRPQTCVFAFQSFRSYLLIVVMMTMGIILRHSPLPKHLLAVGYLGLGYGLSVASLIYFDAYLRGSSSGPGSVQEGASQ